MAARDILVESVDLTDIFVVGDRRPVVAETVEALAGSIAGIGLQHPITVRYVEHLVDPVEGELDGAYVLVAGRHRLEAARSLGLVAIDCVVTRWDKRQARKWEIAENLHRADLTELQRKEEIAEWIAITESEAKDAGEKPAQSAQVSAKGGRGQEGGLSAAARELGVDRTEAQRAKKIAAITTEAKEAVIEAGLADNQSVLMEVAKAEPSKQAAKVHDIVQARALKTEQDIRNRAAQYLAEVFAENIPPDIWDGLKANLEAAGRINLILAAFNNHIGAAVMDRNRAWGE